MTALAQYAVVLVLAIPLGAGLLLALVPSYRVSAGLNVVASLLTFLVSLQLFVVRPPAGQYLQVDDLNIVFIVLNTFVAFTTSVFSATYIAHELETGRLTPGYLRFYHAMFQIMMFGMNLALVANNIGLMWVAIELATLTTVVMVGLYRTHEALEAAWKYFILGSVGIGLALFGTILVYMAARPVIGQGLEAMAWTSLMRHVADFDPALLNVAFVFLLLGYGTKVGLAPLHAWLPDAHAEGPTPISAVLSGLLLNVALYAVLRFKMLMTANPDTLPVGPLLVTMGLVSLIFAALMLYRRRDIKRLFGYSSIEHMGIITFAFGMGGPLANFAGLLHMAMHSLTKSAIFFSVGHVAQVKGTQKIADIKGLTRHPSGAGLVARCRDDRDCRPSALRHLHQRVSRRQLHLRARSASGHSAGVGAAAGNRCADLAAWQPGFRKTLRIDITGPGLLSAGLCAFGAGVGGGHLSSGPDGRLVPPCRPFARLGERSRCSSTRSLRQRASNGIGPGRARRLIPRGGGWPVRDWRMGPGRSSACGVTRVRYTPPFAIVRAGKRAC